MSDNLIEFNAYDTIDIVVKRGCTIDMELEFLDDTGEAEDLTGWTWRWTVRDIAGGDEWINLYTGSGITESGGTVTVTVTSALTRAAAGKRGKHDILGRNSDGSEIICPFEGDITFEDVISDEPPSS